MQRRNATHPYETRSKGVHIQLNQTGTKFTIFEFPSQHMPFENKFMLQTFARKKFLTRGIK